MSHDRDHLNMAPSPTEAAQKRLREALYISDDGTTQGGELLHANTVALLPVMTRRNIPETERLILVIEAAKRIAVERATEVK